MDNGESVVLDGQWQRPLRTESLRRERAKGPKVQQGTSKGLGGLEHCKRKGRGGRKSAGGGGGGGLRHGIRYQKDTIQSPFLKAPPGRVLELDGPERKEARRPGKRLCSIFRRGREAAWCGEEKGRGRAVEGVRTWVEGKGNRVCRQIPCSKQESGLAGACSPSLMFGHEPGTSCRMCRGRCKRKCGASCSKSIRNFKTGTAGGWGPNRRGPCRRHRPEACKASPVGARTHGPWLPSGLRCQKTTG